MLTTDSSWGWIEDNGRDVCLLVLLKIKVNKYLQLNRPLKETK